MAAIDSWYKKALPLTQFLKENEMGKLVAPFMLNMGVDIICNEILKISQQTFITDPMIRCNIYMLYIILTTSTYSNALDLSWNIEVMCV